MRLATDASAVILLKWGRSMVLHRTREGDSNSG